MLDSPTVKRAARACGWDEVGIARSEPLDPAHLDRMLALGAEAGMTWLRTQRDKRLDPAKLLPGAKSVIALALNYWSPYAESSSVRPQPETLPEGEGIAPAGKVARYARGRDYHRVLEKRLWALEERLHQLEPEVRTFASVDIAPTMEKAWAERAGIGWVGKNGCLITPRWGSWVLLGTVLVDRELEADAPHPERCGSCEACLPACPTGAIVEPGLIDARRCIAFHTIERRGELPDAIADGLNGWAFGCDDCQTVCPWNRAPEPTPEVDLQPRPGQAVLDLDSLLSLSLEEYRRRFYGTSLARARYEGLIRNAVLSAGYSGDRRYTASVRRHLDSGYPGVSAAARWALGRLGE